MKIIIVILVVIIGIMGLAIISGKDRSNPHFTKLFVSNNMLEKIDKLSSNDLIKITSLIVEGEKGGIQRIDLETNDKIKAQDFDAYGQVAPTTYENLAIHTSQIQLISTASAAAPYNCNVTEPIPYPKLSDCRFIGWKGASLENGVYKPAHCHCW